MAGSSSTPPPSTSTPSRAPASSAAEVSVRGFPALAFDDYHRRVLPARCRSGAGRAAARDVRGARPIAFLLTDGRAYRFLSQAAARPDFPTFRARVASSLADVHARRLRFRGAGGGEPGGHLSPVTVSRLFYSPRRVEFVDP